MLGNKLTGGTTPGVRYGRDAVVLELAAVQYGTTIDLRLPVTERASVTQPASASMGDHGAPSPVAIGRVLRDRYVLEQRLGSGGMGTVFKALDRFRSDLPQASQYVAIKILHENTDSRPELLENLRREFYCTQMLSHRNVVKVYELDKDGDIDFFTMELLEGELLSTVTERLKPLPMSRPYAWAIIREIGSGLAHAHARNVVHTDLKPHNIMITHAGEVRILDFGASCTSPGPGPVDVLHRRNALSALTPAYACCELLAGRSADPRDDLYAFACLAYELLAGTHPFQRRPSTLARDLGIVPMRPSSLRLQQWKALTMGLSWHRAGRSISVSAWLKKLHAERAAAIQLPGAHDLKSAPARSRPASIGAASLSAVLLIALAVCMSFIRLPPGGKIKGAGVIPAVAANSQFTAGAAIPGPFTAGAPATNTGSAAPPAIHSQLSSSIKPDAFRPKAPTSLLNPIVVAASNYRIRSGENFAEIRVHRTSISRRDAAFVWWTEAASAKPGIDYVQQAKVTQSFPKGKSSTSFFVKLVPKASRAQRAVFYIAIAEADLGTSSGQVARSAIWLPTTHDHS